MRHVTIILALALSVILISNVALAKPPKNKAVKERFYIFGPQAFDGNKKIPQGIWINSREKAQFDRLMRLKKSFLPAMWQTSKESVFR